MAQEKRGKLDSEMSQLRANTLGLVMNQRGEATNKFSKTEKNTMFWALPYIGVLQSEYADKKKK